MNIKKSLLQACYIFVDKRLQTIQNTIASNQQALHSETKSSAGDKHETGRAMLQLEIEKAGQQLDAVLQMKLTLSKIEVAKSAKNVCLGSLVETNIANYFIAVSAGEFWVNETKYFAISLASPIGRLLLGKKEKERLIFNNKSLQILSVK